MAKRELLKEAQKAGVAPEAATEDDYTEAELRTLLNPAGEPAWKGSASAAKPVIGPDGHVHLSQEDINNRA